MVFRTSRFISGIVLLALIGACGGGGGGGGGDSVAAPVPDDSASGPEPTILTVIDGIPNLNAANVDPDLSAVSFTHPGQSDLTLSYSGDCGDGVTLRRTLFDMSSNAFDQLLEHRFRCNLTDQTSYTLTVDGARPNDAAFQASHEFNTGSAMTPGLTILDQLGLPRATVDDMFNGYVEGALLAELDLPGFVEALILESVLQLAEANWDNLVDPNALYDVNLQRVSYLSHDPSGAPSDQLTALIAFPAVELAPDFVMRDKMLVLTHATGSTPGDLAFTDAWLILASLFASRGYLVVAPDNYGRGGTDDQPETYLIANRTASNALSLIQQVQSDSNYDAAYDGTTITIIGYSQGGHSAVGLWQLLETQGQSDIDVAEVYAGGAPHNLYQTVRGVMQHLNGSCNGGAYCETVDEDVTVPFATNRILPAFVSYTDTGGLQLADLVDGETLTDQFVSGFLENDAQYDLLKQQLQLSTFTNVESGVITDSATLVHLYHSRFDRLVPIENTEELAALLEMDVTVDYHTNRCNADGYEVIFNLTDIVGVLHTLCGLAVLDDAMEDLQ